MIIACKIGYISLAVGRKKHILELFVYKNHLLKKTEISTIESKTMNVGMHII